jgi:hypothetical protein
MTEKVSATISVIEGVDVTTVIKFVKNSVAIDITWRTIFFTVKARDDFSKDDSSAIFKKNITSHTNPSSWISSLVIDASDTDDQDLGEYKYNFLLKDGSGKLQATKRGVFEIIENVTQVSA